MNSRYQGTRNGAAAASDREAGRGAVQAPLGDAEFLAALEAGTLPETQFDHAAHVRALGKRERYHETITIAFMSLIHAQLWRQAEGGDWEEFRARNPQLFRSDALLAYYPKQVLESPEARARFLLMPLTSEPQAASPGA